MKSLWGAVFALAVAGLSFAAYSERAEAEAIRAAENDDDETRKPRKVFDEESYLDLLRRVRTLEEAQQQDDLEKAAAQEKQKEQEELPARVSKLEKAQFAPTWDASKMLTFSTPDGNFTAKVGGRLYATYRAIQDRDDTVSNPDSFSMDSARLLVEGSFFKDFAYRVEYEAKNASAGQAARVTDAYLIWSGVKHWFSFEMGQFKAPFSQEETCSSRFIDFAERSLLSQFAPSYTPGAMLFGAFADGVVQWSAGVFNGGQGSNSTTLALTDFYKGRSDTDLNDEKAFIARVFLTPFKNSGNLFKTLRVGLDLWLEDIDARPNNALTQAHPDITGADEIPVFGLIDFAGASATTQVDGQRTMFNINFHWSSGPFALRGQYMNIDHELIDTAVLASDFTIKAYSATATYLLTGEEKPLENRVKPNHNFNPLEGGWGAWELTLRYSQVDAEDAADAGLLVDPDGGGPLTLFDANAKVSQVTVGINWWMTPNICLRLNYDHFMTDEEVAFGSGSPDPTDAIDVFYVRFQIDF